MGVGREILDCFFVGFWIWKPGGFRRSARMNSPSLGYTLMMTLALILPTLFSFALSLMSPAQTCREVVRDASRRIVQTIERQKQTGGSERAVIRDASGRITGQPDVPSGPNPDKIKQMVGKFDTGDQMNDVLVLTLSDFGRTVAENGTSGTDHGWANCMIAIGGGVAKNDKPVLGGQGWHRKISTNNVTSNTPRISVMF